SWATGLEIVSPLEEATIFSQPLKDHIEQRGEGLLGVIFGVADIEEARKRALGLGYEISPLIENRGDEPYAHETETMKETVIGNFLNSLIVFGEIKYAPGVVRIKAD